MVLGDLIVLGRCGTLAAVGRVAFDNGTVHLLHQIGNQLGPEIVAVGRFAGREFYRDGADGLPVQRLIDCDQALRGDIISKIDDGFFGFGVFCGFLGEGRTGGEHAEDEAEGEQKRECLFHA